MSSESNEILHAGYTGPVARLLDAGVATFTGSGAWPDYAATYGLGAEDGAELIRMACDRHLYDRDADHAAAWAPVHAWRTLGQLRVPDAVRPLIKMVRELDEADGADQEIPIVLAMIGPPAIPLLAASFADRSADPVRASIAAEGLKEIAERFPEHRDECVGILTGLLRRESDTDRLVNGFVVSVLLDMQAVEAIDVIREAFGRDAVDISIPGDLEDAEIALGLRKSRATPKPQYVVMQDRLMPMGWSAPPSNDKGWRPAKLADPATKKVGRNEPCPCGSGKKFKKCCMAA